MSALRRTAEAWPRRRSGRPSGQSSGSRNARAQRWGSVAPKKRARAPSSRNTVTYSRSADSFQRPPIASRTAFIAPSSASASAGGGDSTSRSTCHSVGGAAAPRRAWARWRGEHGSRTCSRSQRSTYDAGSTGGAGAAAAAAGAGAAAAARSAASSVWRDQIGLDSSRAASKASWAASSQSRCVGDGPLASPSSGYASSTAAPPSSSCACSAAASDASKPATTKVKPRSGGVRGAACAASCSASAASASSASASSTAAATISSSVSVGAGGGENCAGVVRGAENCAAAGAASSSAGVAAAAGAGASDDAAGAGSVVDGASAAAVGASAAADGAGRLTSQESRLVGVNERSRLAPVTLEEEFATSSGFSASTEGAVDGSIAVASAGVSGASAGVSAASREDQDRDLAQLASRPTRSWTG